MPRLKITLLLTLALLIASACARQPEQLVLAPTSTPAGAIVPTRQPTLTQTPTVESSATSTEAATATPTDEPSLTPTETGTSTATATETLANTETPVSTQTPTEAQLPTDAPDTLAGAALANSSSLYPAVYAATLRLDTPASNRIDSATPFVYFAFEASAGQTYDIQMDADDSRSITLRPMLMVIDPDGAEVARTSIYNTEFSTAVRGFTAPATGVYSVIATRVNGEYGRTEGDFSVTVTQGAAGTTTGIAAQTLTLNQVVSGAISNEVPEQLYVFFGQEGTSLSAVMDAAGALDSRILLYDNAGRMISTNDDDFEQPPGNVDSRINGYVLARTGFYSVLATRFFENTPTLSTGSYRLKVDDLGIVSAEEFRYEAVIDSANTSLVTALNQTYGGFLIGEFQPTGESTGVRIDALVTFTLPPIDANAWTSAELAFEPCRESEGGLDGLGEMSILEEPFGELDSADRDLSRVTSGARVVARATSCAALDFTETVRAAYEAGETRVQIRLTFRNPPVNSTIDSISVTPRLFLSP